MPILAPHVYLSSSYQFVMVGIFKQNDPGWLLSSFRLIVGFLLYCQVVIARMTPTTNSKSPPLDSLTN